MTMQLPFILKTSIAAGVITGMVFSNAPPAEARAICLFGFIGNCRPNNPQPQPQPQPQPLPQPLPLPAPPPPVGSSQSNAILPTFRTFIQQGSQVFRTGRTFFNAGRDFFRTGRTLFSFLRQRPRQWFDPPTADGFVYSMAPDSDSLFTGILDFPTGIDGDNLFTVSVGDTVLGQFSPGQSVNFVDLLGYGVPEFAITGIDPLVDPESENPFPLLLDFNTDTADFTMTDLEKTEAPASVPEPSAALGLLVFGVFGAGSLLLCKRQQFVTDSSGG